jgi:sensor histidine kinase YesM
MSSKTKHFLNVYGTRSLFALGIFVFFNVSSENTTEAVLTWTNRDTAFLIYVFIVVMIIWEMSERIISYYKQHYLKSSFSKRNMMALFGVDIVAISPAILLSTYFSTYYLIDLLGCPPLPDYQAHFWRESVQALTLGMLIVGFQILRLYIEYTVQIERDKALIQKELLLSKYETLKNQVNPHFLFNSFSVLSSLIETDSQKARKFLDKLSRMYRYILDNRDNQMIPLEKELKFTRDYLYLLKTRHEESLEVNIDLGSEVDHMMVPALSLQMLIENAVKHNNFSVDDPLYINIYNEGEEYLVIQNKLRKKNSVVKSTKIGLENIKNRYNLQTDKNVIINEDSGFFTVKLPIQSQLKLA